MRKLKILSIVLAAAVIQGAGSFIISASLLTKYIGEKYGEQLIGRKIRMDWAYVNPFTGYVHLSKLKVYEYKNDSVFVAMDGLTANFNMMKLTGKEMEISSLTMDHPTVKIIQRKLDFNFDDFGRTFAPKKPHVKGKNPFHFYFLNVKVIGGHFYYIDEVIPVNFSIKDVSVDSRDGWCWNRDYIIATTSFLSERGSGGMKGTFGMNLKNLFYKMDVVVRNFDLNIFEQYMHEFSNYGAFRANLDADLRTNGNFSKAENVNLEGRMAISDFHIGKDSVDDYVAFEKLVLNMDNVNPQNHKYLIDSVVLQHPYLKFERYDGGLDNIQTMFGRKGSKVLAASSESSQFNLVFTLGRYVAKLASNFFKSYYEVNHLAISKSDVNFMDFTLGEKFSIELDPLDIKADTVNINHHRANLYFDAMVKPYGKINVFISTSPKDTGDFDLTYRIKNIPLSMFNAYTITYTAYPFDYGTLELNGSWSLRNSMISSKNHVVVIDSRLANRVKNDDAKWLPMRLIMVLARRHGNVIDYDIPIKGNLKDPKFFLSEIILDVVKNIFINPPAKSHVVQVKNLEAEIDKSLTMQWEMHQYVLRDYQERFVKNIAGFLKKNPEASITVYPKTYAVKEKEQILFYEAKKKFYLENNHKNVKSLDEDDIEAIDKMSIKDISFVRYMKRQVSDSMVFTLQERCNRLISEAILNAGFEQLNHEREKAFMKYFTEKGVEKQVKMASNENLIPYNGFSLYKIQYHGKQPESLVNSNEEMKVLKNETKH